MVSIAAFQAVDPGSIPGHRIVFRSITKPLNFVFKNSLWFSIYKLQMSLVIRGGYVPEKFMTHEYQIYFFWPTYA